MPCAECWAAAGVPYTPAADQSQERSSEPSSAERVLKHLKERGELVSLPWELEKPKRNTLQQRLRQQQRRTQRADHWEQEQEQWEVKPQNFNNDQRRHLRLQLSNGNDVCPKECGCSSRRKLYTWNWIDDITSSNCRNRSFRVGKSTSSKVCWRDNGARPLTLAQSDSRDAAAGATSEAQAGEATTAGSMYVKALGLLNKLFPFPEGSKFVPSMPTGPFHKQRTPPETTETTAADLDVPGGSSSRTCCLDNARQSHTSGVYGNKVKMEGQTRHQEETLDPSEWQLFAGLNTSVATLQQANDVLLTESLENLLLLEPPIVQQKQQPVSGLQRSRKYTAQIQQMQGICGFRKQRNIFSQPPRWMQASNNSNDGRNSTDSNSSNDDCVCAPEVVPHCHSPRHCDRGSRSKRRPGISSCWHQTAALLHSLIATEDRPEPQHQHGHPATPHAAHEISRAADISEGVVGGGGGASADCLISPSSATIQKGCSTPCIIGRASATTAASILQQQNVEADCCQSLPAEVARQILRRIASGAVQLHTQHENAERMHTQEQTAELLQEHSDPKQDLHQEQQEEQQVQGEGDRPTEICCCSVSTCRSFCAYLLHLLGDIRTQQVQHERLQLLLLQLLLLLVQQQLACAICRFDEGFVRHYRSFVVQQMGQLLGQQEQREDEQLTPDLLLLDSHSLHHQKWVLLLLQLALLLRAWRTDGRAGGSRCVIKVAYACLLHMDVCFELREGAADILAAAALDELSVAIQEAAVHVASDEAAWWAGAEATASADIETAAGIATTAGGAAAQGAGREAGALALCDSITKAAVEGRSAAAAAAAELASSVACCFLLMLQQSAQHEVFPSRVTAVGLKVRPHIRKFSVEAAAPAYPLLVLLLLPALEQQLLKGEALQDTAATPLSLSLHAAEALHLVRMSLFHAQQHLFGQQHSQPHGVRQPQQRVSMLWTLQQQLLFRVLEQQLMKFLYAAIRACTEQFDHLLSLLRREGPARSKIGRGSTSTSWSILEAAATAAEAPLCCICVLVQLPRLTLGGAAAVNSAFDGETLEVVAALLVNLLLKLVGSCSWDPPPQAAREAMTEAAGTPAVAGSSVFVATAAFGCFSKLLVALTEAARSACMQIQKVTAAATASDLPKGVSSAAEALQQCFACGAAAVLTFCLESAAAGHPVQQQEQVSEFIAAAADADIAILRFLALCKEQPQLRQPLACQLLQQILENPISDRGGRSNSCNGRSSGGTTCSSSNGTASDSKSIIFIRSSSACLDTGDLHSSETICRSGREDLTAAAAAATDGAAVEPLACVAADASAGTALQALARLLEDRKVAVASATAPSYHTAGGFSEAAAFSNTVADDAVASAAAAAASAGRLLRIAWIRVVGPALHEVCVHRPPAAVAAATEAEGLKATTGAKASSKATEASVQVGQQHALAIIETRGSLISAFVSAVAAAASAATTAAGWSKKKKGVEHELQQLRGLQRDFTMVLQNATLAAALVVLSHEQPGSVSCCDRSSNLQGSCSTSFWNTAQHQDPVGVLQQLLRSLLLHYSTEPTNMRFSSSCSRCSGGCLWRVILQVSVAVASLRPLVLQLFLWPLRYLLSLQREDKGHPERHLVEIWHVLYTCFSSGKTAAAGAAPNNSSSNGCCCCGIVKLEEFLQQDDWVQVSDLILELLKLLQQTACSASATAASPVPRLAAAAAEVERKAAAERADQRPPQTE